MYRITLCALIVSSLLLARWIIKGTMCNGDGAIDAALIIVFALFFLFPDESAQQTTWTRLIIIPIAIVMISSAIKNKRGKTP